MATINVTTTVDENNGTGEVSLREAIIQANSTLVEDNIILTAGQTYKLTLANLSASTEENKAATGDLDIVEGGKTTISVVGDGKATVDGGGIDRVFDVTTQLASLTLKNIIVTGGKSTGSGGGIYNSGNLALESSIVSGNGASGSRGGGIYSNSSGNLNILNSTVSENSGYRGGGISNNGIAQIINSNISSNIASYYGGGINNDSRGNLTVTNSTISSNLSSRTGGGIHNRDSLTVTNSTISSNLASGKGGGIYNSDNLNIGNSIVAKNISSDSLDISKDGINTLTSQGNNLIGSTSYTLTTTDKVGVDPLLGDLQNNGGPTATHALLGGSPAIDAGTSTLTRDQRGFGRLGVSDIGAFEYNGINDLIPPSVTTFTPADEATGILPTTDLVINFSEPIKKGTGGNIFIRKVSDNTLVETIAGTSDKIIVNGSQVTINPGIDLASGTDYYVEITPDVVTDAIGNNFLGITGSTTWNFRTADNTPPTVTNFTPADNATAVTFGANLVANFSEPIQKGTGSIVIKKLADNSVAETIDVSTTNISISNNQLIINPIADLAENTGYYVEIPNTAIKDISGNAYAGIVGGETWNFQTADVTAPVVLTINPTIGATGIALGSDLVANFNEPVQKGTGSIVIKKTIDNSVAETIDVASTDITVTGNQMIINPINNLGPETNYYVEIANGAIKDLTGNAYAGITGNASWNFQTADSTPPTVTNFTPVDNATAVAIGDNLVINFSETVQKGAGNIVIKKVADNSVVETIDVTGTNVTAANNQLTIDPVNNLAENTAYYVEIANGAVKDIAGNSYPGIVGGEAWNFQTQDITAPKHTVLNPVNNATNVKVGSNLVVQFNESIQKGTTGNIIIKEVNGDDVIETIPVTATNITVGGNQLTINPVKDLGSKTNYYVEIEAGAIKDLAGNSYEGISDNDTWTFQTPDILPPVAQTFSPKDDSTKVKPTDNLVVTFDEPINKGTGNIFIKKVDTGSVLETIKMTSKAITTSGNKLTINPSKNLDLNTEYYVEIGKGAIKDVTGNNHLGIKGKTIWNFSTITATSSADLIVGTAKADIIDGLAGNDSITGLAGNDKLTGGDGNDRLDGGDGNDSLIGSAGNDVFLTSAGNDILTGGAGADQLIYNTDAKFATKAIGIDTISDFSRNQGDKIVLSQGTFEKIDSKVGNSFSVKTEFASVKNNPGASDALIVYNSSTGQLFYNENGKASGFGTGGEFLKLTNKTGLSISDFVIQA